MIKRDMKTSNWVVTFAGAVLIVLGYILVSPITRDYETPKAFFAILTLNIGLLTVIIGLAANFEGLAAFFGKRSEPASSTAPIVQNKSAAQPEAAQASVPVKNSKQKRGAK